MHILVKKRGGLWYSISICPFYWTTEDEFPVVGVPYDKCRALNHFCWRNYALLLVGLHYHIVLNCVVISYNTWLIVYLGDNMQRYVNDSSIVSNRTQDAPLVMVINNVLCSRIILSRIMMIFRYSGSYMTMIISCIIHLKQTLKRIFPGCTEYQSMHANYEKKMAFGAMMIIRFIHFVM